MTDYEIYTDGACNTTTRDGGWAYIILQHGKVIASKSGREKDTTNNQMEVIAAIRALRRIPSTSSVTLYSDSTYTLRGFEAPPKGHEEHDCRFSYWKSIDWKDLKNADMLNTLYAESLRLFVNVKWVKGHSGNKYNEQCDALASGASKETFKKQKNRDKHKQVDKFMRIPHKIPRNLMLIWKGERPT